MLGNGLNNPMQYCLKSHSFFTFKIAISLETLIPYVKKNQQGYFQNHTLPR